MSKNKKHLLILLLITLTILLPYNLNKESKVINTITTVLKQKDNKPNKVKEIGILEIPKINLKRYLYDINSDLNKVDKNVTIIKKENGFILSSPKTLSTIRKKLFQIMKMAQSF